VPRFEEAFSRSVNSRYGVACASGTAAIHVALQVAGISAGDEVFVSDFTFIATANPITYRGATPVFVDANDATWNMDPVLVAEELDRRAARGIRQPKAVLVAHVLGMPADLAPIQDACERHGVILLEDAAEALGARYAAGSLVGRQVGTIGLFGCFSFNGNKIITTGGGGLVATADEVLAETRQAPHDAGQAARPGVPPRRDRLQLPPHEHGGGRWVWRNSNGCPSSWRASGPLPGDTTRRWARRQGSRSLRVRRGRFPRCGSTRS